MGVVFSSGGWRWCGRVGVFLACVGVFRGWCLGRVLVWRVLAWWVWVRLLDECFGGFGCSRVWPLSFSCFCLLSCLVVWLITGCLGFGRVLGRVGGWRACSWPVLVCFFLFGEGVSCVGWCRAVPWCALGGVIGLLFLVVRVCAL